MTLTPFNTRNLGYVFIQAIQWSNGGTLSSMENIRPLSRRQLPTQVGFELKIESDRRNTPITLDPKTASFEDIAIWAERRRRLSQSTIQKRLRYARFMETHPCPVDFRNPTFENFIRHCDYREEIEQATPGAMKHEWKTMRMFLQAYGIPLDTWPYRPPTSVLRKPRILPYPDTVRQFFYYDYTDDRYTNALYQYLFYLNFMIGWRVPSEICEMRLSDVHFDGKGRGSITITETKKRKSQRTIHPEYFILDSKSHKSLKNWIDKWRPRVENQYSEDALFLYSNGKPVTTRRVGHILSQQGKKIWPYFHPYDTRHWCATARLIETKIQSGSYDVEYVRNWLGHTTITTTQIYTSHADQYYRQCPVSWIHTSLRARGIVRVKSMHPSVETELAFKRPLWLNSYRENMDGPVEI